MRGHLSGEAGKCGWFYFAESLEDKDWDAYVEAMYKFLSSPVARSMGMFTVTYGIQPPTAKQRADLHRLKGLGVKAHAHATDSRAIHAAGTAVNFFIPKGFPEKFMSSPSEALRWLKEQAPEADTEVLWSDVRANVPPAHLWNA